MLLIELIRKNKYINMNSSKYVYKVYIKKSNMLRIWKSNVGNYFNKSGID